MRLRSVTMKNGGAKVRVLHTPTTHEIDGVPENWQGRIIDHARHIAGLSTPDRQLDGFVIVGLFSDGTSSIGCRVPASIPRCLLPAYVEELVRRDVVTENKAERVFDQRFQWVEQ